MKTFRFWVTIIVVLFLGFGSGSVYYGFIKVNPAIKESLEHRTITHLSEQGYDHGQYTMRTLKTLKFDGMHDYRVDVQFRDEPGHNYYYGENKNGEIFQNSWNGTKHIEE
ncbi:DUF3139 domain-containing protein [Cohnella lupini]|uniref:Uncharacterized protein DUF3139 n=1 Tax=Cohnella lupini TaxID=1294267 RepID=A0A3D9HQB2_9BACL|nr:DUF3139 domain-containing protein [Cohnella lupini]RED51106.1 uncharacterized protein DUF3139 [Cohnella lupini]